MKNRLFGGLKRKLSSVLVAGAILTSGCVTINNQVQEQIKPNKSEEYALLINGNSDYNPKTLNEDETNIINASNKLQGIGYNSKNIITLGGDSPSESNPKSHFKSGEKKSFNEAINQLKEQVDNNDTLLVYTTGHGDSYEGVGQLVLETDTKEIYELMDVREIVKSINKVPFGRLIYIGDQCYSGAFVDELKKLDRNLVAVSDIDAHQQVYAASFTKGFWNAVGNKEYDLNQDGGVDVKEAYQEGMKQLNEHFNLHLFDLSFPGQYATRGRCNHPSNIKFCE